MIRLEFTNISEFEDFINLIKSLDDTQIKKMSTDLNTASDTLITAEKKDANASTSAS